MTRYALLKLTFAFATAVFCGWLWWTLLAAIATVGVDR